MSFLDGRLTEIVKNINVKKLTNTPKLAILGFLIIVFGLTLIVILNADKRTKEEVITSDIKVEETDEYDDKYVKNQADLFGYKKNEDNKLPNNLKEEEYNKIFANDPSNKNSEKNSENEFLKEFGLSDEEVSQAENSLNILQGELDNISKSIPALPVLVLLDKETNMYSISGMSERFSNGKKKEDKYLTIEQRQALAEQELIEENAKRQELSNALKSSTLIVNIESKNPVTKKDTNNSNTDINNKNNNKDILDNDFRLYKSIEDSVKGEIKTGFVIPAILLTQIESELKGMVVGQVRQNVYDTATGEMLLIPQGTKLVGDYQSDIQYGAKRIFVNWKRLIFPNGTSLDIGMMPGADMSGTSGFHDKYNNHFWEMFGNSLLFSFVLAGVNLSQTPDLYNQFLPLYSRGAATSLSEGLGQSLGETMSQMIRKNLNIAPDITIRSGYLFNVMITKDIVLPEYSD